MRNKYHIRRASPEVGGNILKAGPKLCNFETIKNLAFIILSSLFCASAWSQDYVNDAQVWTGIQLEKKLPAKFDASLSAYARFSNNLTQLGAMYYRGVLGYKVNSYVKIGIGYTFKPTRNLDESYSNRHRLFGDITLKKDFGRCDLQYRNRTQLRMKDIYSSEDGMTEYWYNRSRLQLAYTLTKQVKLSASEEVYYRFMPTAATGYTRLRTNAGFNYKINRSSSVELMFIYRHQLNATKIAEHDYVYRVTYILSL